MESTQVKIEEMSQVGLESSKRGTWKSINKRQVIHSYHSSSLWNSLSH